MQSQPYSDQAQNAFHLRPGASIKPSVELVVQPPGSRTAPTRIWSRDFASAEDRNALLGAVETGRFDPVFLRRLTMVFGSASLDQLADDFAAGLEAARAAEFEAAAQRARDHLVVNLYARETKQGRHRLELQRRSSTEAEWFIVYDRAIERDRLCDWLRWQKSRFLHFLDHAAEHGNEALSRMLIDEMFVTERRVKKEGRGAGGMRPLRMWRGD